MSVSRKRKVDNLSSDQTASKIPKLAAGTSPGDSDYGKFIVGKAMEDEPEIKQPQHAGLIPKVPFRWGFIGPSKSGKSNLARWMLEKFYTDPNNPKKSFFKKIHLLSPTGHIDYNWAGLPGLDNKDIHTEPTGESLQKILNEAKKKIQGTLSDKVPAISKQELKRRKERADQFLVIADDAIAETALINSQQFLKMMYQIRHYGGSVMLMSQSYKKVPRSGRLQFSHLSVFQPMASEIERLHEDHSVKQMNKKEFVKFVQDLTATAPGTPGGDFPFLQIESWAPSDIKFRRNLTDFAPLPDHVDDGEEGPGGKRTKEWANDDKFTEDGILKDEPVKQRQPKRKRPSVTPTAGSKRIKR